MNLLKRKLSRPEWKRETPRTSGASRKSLLCLIAKLKKRHDVLEQRLATLETKCEKEFAPLDNDPKWRELLEIVYPVDKDRIKPN